jgi:hypothetical protein
MFTKGFFVLGFDLTPDKETDEENIFLPRQGNVRIEAHFKKPLPEPVTCVLYTEFPGHIEIDNSRNVTVERIIVINLDKHYMPGSHWAAVCFSDTRYAECFESYGLPPLKL